MAATGTLKKALIMGGEGYPAQNSRNNRQKVAYWMRETMKFRLTGYTAAEVAAGTPYTYTLFTVGAAGARLIGKIIEAVFLVSPEALAEDATNYNTLEVEIDATPVCARTTALGIRAYEPWEVSVSAVEATRTLAADDVVTLVATATLTASAIADGAEIWLVLKNA